MSEHLDFPKLFSSFNSKKFSELRSSQVVVLETYSKQYFPAKDVAVELPTGAGKTLIALLISEAWRSKGKKVAILSANKTLARQLRSEADALGIPAVLMEGRGIDIPSSDKRHYQRATKVAVMNYWVYFNQNPVVDPADLLIMDDAHLAEHCLHSLYSVEISRLRHSALFETLIEALHSRFPEYRVIADAMADDIPQSATELLSFIDQMEVLDRLREIVDTSPALEEDVDLRYRWNRMRSLVQGANIYVSLTSIWIRPYVYPLITNLHYNQATQRLYMSATIGDPSDLSRRLGVNPIVKIPIPQEHAEKTSGRRMIVINRLDDDKNIPKRAAAVILMALKVSPKSVWLCASDREARTYKELVSNWLGVNGMVGHPTWLLTPLGDEIDEFKKAPKGHLFVAGRFDGMDFRRNECSLVILTTLPRAINAQEEFICAYLRDAGFMTRRLNQRIVQALGRCNRSDEDYGIYVLADRRFATHFGRESNKDGIPSNIIAEIDMAQDLADRTEPEFLNAVSKFLIKDFSEYDQSFKHYLADVPQKSNAPETKEIAHDEVIGWASMFFNQNYEVAADKFAQCWDAAKQENLLEIGALYGYFLAKALHLDSSLNNPSSRLKALETLDLAIRRGGLSSWFNRLRASLNRATQSTKDAHFLLEEEYRAQVLRVFDDHLEKFGNKGNRFDKWCNSLTEKLDSRSHSQFQQGLLELGALLAYATATPQYNAATDCRWRGVFGNTKELITFEAKIEHTESNEISAKDVGQAHVQYNRAIAELEKNGYTVRAVIVTHLGTVARDAKPSLGNVRILTKDSVQALWKATRILLSLYRDHWSLYDIGARKSGEKLVAGKLPKSGWLARALGSDSQIIDENALLKEWKR